MNTFLEVDELWTFVGSKKNKVWLIYAYDRGGGEIVAYARGKRDIATVREPETRLNSLKMTYDKWQVFAEVFDCEKSNIGKKYTVGIEGHHRRLRHRNRRIVRKPAVFQRNCSTTSRHLTDFSRHQLWLCLARHTFQATTEKIRWQQRVASGDAMKKPLF